MIFVLLLLLIIKIKIILIKLVSRYGVRATTEHCTVAIIVMSLQSILGVVIQVTTVIIIIMRPKTRWW